MKKDSLDKIKSIYVDGENIIQYLKDMGNLEHNTDEMIMISYDFQSGSYIKSVNEKPEFNEKYTKALSKIIDKLNLKDYSLLEVGVGEATTLANIVPKLNNIPNKVYGFDLSWSRVRYAIEYMKKNNISNSFLFRGDLFNIPLSDNSIDLVYTSHSIEPNGGREEEAFLELMRITKRYLILLEPAYELASSESKKRMNKHGYVKNLYSNAVSLGFKVIEHTLFDVSSNPLNPTGLMIIEKSPENDDDVKNPFICPITKTPLNLMKGSFFTKDGLLVYPIIDGVPCILRDDAIIATHYGIDFELIDI